VTVQSLANALAHVVSTLSTGSLADADRDAARAAAAEVVRAIDELLGDPRSRTARELAQRGASTCAIAIDRGKPGVHHAIAHLLGGALRVDHAALHALLLPHSIAHLRATDPAIVLELECAIWPDAPRDLGGYLREALGRAGAPTSLAALGATRDAVISALASRPELPSSLALAAFDDVT
jgi:maleylacetate reductase